MSKIKEIVKEDFTNKANINLKFDTKQLKNNEKKDTKVGKFFKIAGLSLTGALVCVFVITAASLFIRVEDDEEKIYKKVYAQNELSKIENNSFKKLNEIEYPDGTRKVYSVSDEYKKGVKNFSDKIYKNIDDDQKNFSFSPYGLYSNLCIDSLASNNEIINNEFDNLLGVKKENRKDDFVKALFNDYYFNEDGTTQLYNASFQTNSFKPNQKFIDELTDYNCEAFKLDFSKKSDIEKMLQWVNERINEEDFIKEKDLEIDSNSVLFTFSTLYFNNKWKNTFVDEKTKTDIFNINENSTVKCDFMNKSYLGDYYNYGSYSAFYDYYYNGMKIKYLIPNSGEKLNIFDLTKNVNIFEDDESKKILSNIRGAEIDELIINLSMPKFESEYKYDFTELLKNIGLNDAFSMGHKAFNYVFSNLDESTDIYIDKVKQMNKVSFGEDGTEIKSVTFTDMKPGSAGPIEADTIDISLDQPFIYIIYDSNDLPLYLGHINNPTL